MSTTDKVFVFLSSMINDLSRNMNDHYLGLAKQVQILDEKFDVVSEQVKKADKKIFTAAQQLVERHLNPLHKNIDYITNIVNTLKKDLTDEEEDEGKADQEKVKDTTT